MNNENSLEERILFIQNSKNLINFTFLFLKRTKLKLKLLVSHLHTGYIFRIYFYVSEQNINNKYTF